MEHHDLYESFIEIFATLNSVMGAIAFNEQRGYTFVDYELLENDNLKLYFVK